MVMTNGWSNELSACLLSIVRQVADTNRKKTGRPTAGHIDIRHRPALYQILHHDPWLYVDEIVKRVNEHPTVIGERNYNENAGMFCRRPPELAVDLGRVCSINPNIK